MSDSINSDRENLRNIKEITKIAEKKNKVLEAEIDNKDKILKASTDSVLEIGGTIKKLKVKQSELNTDIDEKRAEIDRIDDKLKSKEGLSTEKISALVGIKEDELRKLTEKISLSNVELADIEQSKDRVVGEVNILELQYDDIVRKIEDFSEEIEKYKKEEDKIKDNIKKLSVEKTEVQKIKDKHNDLTKENADIQKEIVEGKGELLKFEGEKAKRMEVVLVKEKEISRREERVINREEGLDDREKDIDLKAKTLQKHYDKQNIPINIL